MIRFIEENFCWRETQEHSVGTYLYALILCLKLKYFRTDKHLNYHQDRVLIPTFTLYNYTCFALLFAPIAVIKRMFYLFVTIYKLLQIYVSLYILYLPIINMGRYYFDTFTYTYLVYKYFLIRLDGVKHLQILPPSLHKFYT